MLETLLITWRETLEAALVVGILLTYLARSGQRRALRYVWLGSAAAVVAALACAAASRSALAMLAGGLAGAALAIATAWVFFRGFAFLSLRTFFRATGVLLLLVAAGLLTSGVNKLIGLGYLPPLVPQVWNTSWLVRDGSPLGAVLSALVGYRSRPSLLEVLAYALYFPPMLWALNHGQPPPPADGRGEGGARSAA